VSADKHAYQHGLIAARKAVYDKAPKRNGRDRIRRRELGKKAWWTFTGHLRSMHGVKGNPPFLRKTWADLEAMHEASKP
jgi:hypothetical protein